MPNYELWDCPQQIEKSILIEASPKTVWNYLTIPALMKEWMGDEEIEIDILSDWKIGGLFVIKGFHHVLFENRGIITKIIEFIIPCPMKIGSQRIKMNQLSL